MRHGSRKGREVAEALSRPSDAALDRMHAGDCAFGGCPSRASVDVTIRARWDSPTYVWSLCSRHGWDWVNLHARRVYFLGVEDCGVCQQELELDF